MPGGQWVPVAVWLSRGMLLPVLLPMPDGAVVTPGVDEPDMLPLEVPVEPEVPGAFIGPLVAEPADGEVVAPGVVRTTPSEPV